MLIEQVLPEVVGAKAMFSEQFLRVAVEMGIPETESTELLKLVPAAVAAGGCFLDRVVKLWRYEFGSPRVLANNQLLWGTHMWLPLRILIAVLRSARTRLPVEKLQTYLERLGDPHKHDDVLAEFLPILRIDDAVPATPGFKTGVGNHDVDWLLAPPGARPVLVEVKKRMRDLIEVLDRMEAGERDPDGTAPAPVHDVGLLFRSVEKKFPSHDSAKRLQGVWVLPELQQEAGELAAAFDALDSTKVHFAILGGWEPGVTILARRSDDREYLERIFGERGGDRFRLVRGSAT